MVKKAAIRYYSDRIKIIFGWLMLSSLKQNIAQAKPLHFYVWVGVLLLSLGLAFLGNQLLLRYSPASETFVEFYKQRLLTAAQSGDGTIVIIGDSRIKWGMLLPNQLEALLATQGVNKKVVRITHNYGSFNEFQPLVETIFAINPSLIVMQNDLLSKIRTYKYHEQFIRDFTKHAVSSNALWNPDNTDQVAEQKPRDCGRGFNETAERRKEQMAERTYFNANGPLQPNAKIFLTRAQKNGIPTILLSLPVSSAAQKIMPKPFMHPEAISPPANLIKDKDFCDSVHFNINGREKLSPWLATQIAQQLSETP